jgi:hypothetical protein
VNTGRLGIALGGVFLYLLGGAALGWYCFTTAAKAPPPTDTGGQHGNGTDEGGDSSGGGASGGATTGPTVTVDAAERLKIDDAVVKGVWYLKGCQHPSGSWNDGSWPVGDACLPALTLLECGVPASDPIIQKAAKLVRDKAQSLAPTSTASSYQVALAILFLDRLGDPQDDERIQYLALRLAASQRADDGGWGYSCAPLDPDPKARPELLARLGDESVALDEWRKTALKGQPFNPTASDNSNTQFAVLALWVASRHAVPVGRTLAAAGKRFRTSQVGGVGPAGENVSLEGSWYYRPGGNVSRWPSMTCAGLLGLAVANGSSGAAPPADDKDHVQRAFAMLGREIDRPGEMRPVDLYFLWSLERVGVLYELPLIEGKDWYAWGRKPLLEAQQPDGRWQIVNKNNAPVYPGGDAVHDTCFALLFLKQANLAKDLTVKMRLLQNK